MRKVLNKGVKTLFIQGIAFLLSYVIIYDFSSISYWAPMERVSDFRITDFYNIIANKRPSKLLDDNIVIVSIDGCSRDEIAETIFAVDFCTPKAIGLDIFFNFPSADDKYLIKAIQEADNIVLPLNIKFDTSGKVIEKAGSFFYNKIKKRIYGAVNLAGNDAQSVIREFQPYFIQNRDTTLHFAAAIARIANPEAYRQLQNRNKRYETIYFPSLEYETIAASEVLSSRDKLQNKVVLIGAINDQSDQHITPITSQMPGIYLHAYSIATILRQAYIKQTGNVVDWMVAFLLSFITLFVHLSIEGKHVGGLVSRILQLLLLYIIVYCGCRLFIFKHIYLDFSKSLLMVGLCMVASDIWFGTIGIYEFLSKHINHLRASKK